MNKPIYLISICLVGICLSCSTLEKERRNIIVLLDYSASSSDKILREYIRIICEDIAPTMRQYDCLTVVPIDEGSKQEPVKMVFEDFSEKGFNKKSDGFAHAQDSIRKRLDEYRLKIVPKIKTTLRAQHDERKAFISNTDILGAIQQTVNLLEINNDQESFKRISNFVIGKESYISENIIVILSDMIQDSKEYSFNNLRGISRKQAREYLEQWEKNQMLPNLQASKIFVIGTTGKGALQIDNIKDFWGKYFKKCNADLLAYGYDVENKLRKYLNTVN